MNTSFKDIITWMDWVTIVFSFITMFGVLYNLYKNKKQMEKITILFVIESNNKEIVLDKNLIRRDCQRSEIQGVLRTKLIKGRSYYSIDYIGTDDYFKNIFDIQTAKADVLKIYLKDDELEQFGISK
jgi:hypothetical protein